jgi:hypothetical protein
MRFIYCQTIQREKNCSCLSRKGGALNRYAGPMQALAAVVTYQYFS